MPKMKIQDILEKTQEILGKKMDSLVYQKRFSLYDMWHL